MGEKFLITDINRVILVGKTEYSDDMTCFSHGLNSNEIIFHFSGQATVYFDDLILETKPNTVRFLPKGKTARYDVLRHERGECGECIDVFFQTDIPIAPSAFVIDIPQGEKIGAHTREEYIYADSRFAGLCVIAELILGKIDR